MESLNLRPLKWAFLLAIGLVFISCKKEKPTLAKIRVVDEMNIPVEDAEVTLYPDPDPQLKPMIPEVSLNTNDDGIAIFDFTDDFNLGTAGFRVLSIKAEKGDKIGSGIIKIVEEEETLEGVVITLP